MKNLEWGDVGLTLLSMFSVLVVALFVWAAFQDHTIQFYYVSSNGSGQGHNGYCIDGYRYWWPNDNGVFCTDDIEKAVSVNNQLNASLVKRKPQ